MANQKSLTAFFGSGKTKASDKVSTKQGSLKAAFQKGEVRLYPFDFSRDAGQYFLCIMGSVC